MKSLARGFVLVAFVSTTISLVPDPAHAGWTVDGLYVNNLGNPTAMVGDGSGGVFLNWTASKVQRVDANGELLIPANNALLGPVSEATPCFSDGAGGVYIAARQDQSIVLLRVNGSGNVLWTTTICQTTFAKSGLAACADGTGGALVAWSEDRDLPYPRSGTCAYTQRVDASGAHLWTSDGTIVRYATDFVKAGGPGSGTYYGVPVHVRAIVPAAGVAGGALLLTMEEWFDENEIFIVRVDPSGNSVGTSEADHSEIYDRAIPDQDGGAYVWDGASGGWLLMERRSFTVPSWQVAVCTINGANPRHAVACALADGVAIAWSDVRAGAGDENIYIQKFSLDGSAMWATNGIPVCDVPGAQNQVDMAADPHGGLLIVWADGRNGEADIYTLTLDASGNTADEDGVQLSSGAGAVGSDVSPKTYVDPAGYAIVSWRAFYGVFAKRIDMTTVAVAITDFRARVHDGRVELAARFSSNVGVEAVKVYRAEESGPLVLRSNVVALGRDQFEYIDEAVSAGSTYRYQLGVVDADGEFLSPIEEVKLPALIATLEQNHPNPFNPSTSIRFMLPSRDRVTLVIHDTAGREVRTLVDDVRGPGTAEVLWDGRDEAGRPVGSGVYFYRLKAGKFESSRKMVLLK